MAKRIKRRSAEVNWSSQLRKGLLDIVILGALLNDGKMFGLQIISVLRDKHNFAIVEGTIYPLMRRMMEDGLLTAQISTSNPGHPRKYFKITEAGAKRMQEMIAEWRAYSKKVEEITGC